MAGQDATHSMRCSQSAESEPPKFIVAIHASESDPQYEIKSDMTDRVALHKGEALTRLRR
jgi:hypothetical protein